jgi:hypothetical protein
MFQRKPGYYWVAWSERADEELALRRPGPLVAQWDGTVWWFVRSDTYRFECELEVISEISAPMLNEPPQLAVAFAARA